MHATKRRFALSALMAVAVALALAIAPSPALAATRFPDVDYNLWYADGVGYCSRHGLLTGYADGRFGVGDKLTRAQLAALLCRNTQATGAGASVGSSTTNQTGMSDVESGGWYTAAANWAVSSGVINGYTHADGSKTFGPNDPVTLEQMTAILRNYLKQGSASTRTASLASFSDADDISGWAVASVAWAADEGLVGGYAEPDGTRTVRPQEAVTRERAATIIANACRSKIMNGGPKLDQTSVKDAQAAYDAAQKAYDEAVQAADNAAAAKAKGSVGFFEWLGDTDAEKVFSSSQVASGTGTDADGKTFASYTHIGQDGDATSLDNLKAAVELIQRGNELRTSDPNFTGLDPLYVTNELMAIAEMNANWSARAFFYHPMAFGQDSDELLSQASSSDYYAYGENLAAGYANPFDGWYWAEKAEFEANGSSGSTGHYENIVYDGFDMTGLAQTTDSAYGYCHSEEFGFIYQGIAYPVDDYARLLSEYIQSVEHPEDAVAAKKAALDEALWGLEDAKAD